MFRTVLAARRGEIVVRDLAEIDCATRLINGPLLQCRACLATFPLAPGTTVRVAGPQDSSPS